MQARSKKPQRGGARAEAVENSPAGDASAKQGRSVAATVTTGGDDEPIRCTVGFFGVSDVDFLDDEEDDNCETAEAVPQLSSAAATSAAPAPSAAPARPLSRDSYASRHSTPEQRMSAQGASVAPGIARACSQPPLSRPPIAPGSRAESPISQARAPPEVCNSPGAASNMSDPSPGARAAPRPQAQPWKQKAIQVKSADYYLDMLKAARGQKSSSSVCKSKPGGGDGAGAAQAWSDGSGYAEQMRMRANAVEATQREEASARYERGYAALQRVQQRAMHAPSRSVSRDSAPAQLVST